jgi:NitT/TauT family transport system substrate-binding protein
LVRHYATPESALKALAGFEKDGKAARAVYAQDHDKGFKLLADQAWFVVSAKGQVDAFLLKGDADSFAQKSGGEVKDFDEAKLAAQSVPAASR